MWDVFSSTSQQHLIPDNYHNQYLRIYKRGNEQHFLSSRNAARFSTSAWQGDLYRVTHGRPQHHLKYLSSNLEIPFKIEFLLYVSYHVRRKAEQLRALRMSKLPRKWMLWTLMREGLTCWTFLRPPLKRTGGRAWRIRATTWGSQC